MTRRMREDLPESRRKRRFSTLIEPKKLVTDDADDDDWHLAFLVFSLPLVMEPLEAHSMASSSSIPIDDADRPQSTQHRTREEEEGDDATAALEAPSDDSDDEVADFRNLLPQLIAEKEAAAKAGIGLTSSTAAGGATGLGQTHLPKRGEKDFEPTGFRGQEKKLEESRRAMELVIGQSRRTTK